MKKGIKIICILLVSLFVISCSYNVYAQINSNYETNIKVDDTEIENKIKNSKIADAIGIMVYALASAVEDLISWVFKLLTGDKIFPWADRVIFNAIPFLDINFLNPSDNSLFVSGGISTMLSNIVHDVYFTIFSMAIGFLGVIVAITAIKLAVSTIASNKSKYKESIVNWLFAIIMLFTVHFILSFVFYLNEKMVEVASSIITAELGKTEFEIADNEFELETSSGGIYYKGDNKSFIDDLYEDSSSDNRYLWRLNSKIMNLSCSNNQNFVDYLKENPYRNIEYNKIQESIDENMIIDVKNTNISKDVIKMISYLQVCEKICYNEFECFGILNYDNIAKYIKQYIYEKKFDEKDGYINISPFIWLYKNYDIQIVKDAFSFIVENRKIKNKNFSEYEALYNKFKDFGDFCYNLSITDYGIIVSDNNMVWASDAIANMGDIFKELAWQDGWIFNRITFQGALLYAIFLTQSVLFFIAYTKRFFYVIILSIMAPVVVIYDFMIKSVS